MNVHDSRESMIAPPRLAALNQITPLSRSLALVLFIVLPFLGGFIGYNYGLLKTLPGYGIQSEVPRASSLPIASSSELTTIPTTSRIFLTSDNKDTFDVIGLYYLSPAEQKVYYPVLSPEFQSEQNEPLTLVQIEGVDFDSFEVLAAHPDHYFARDDSHVYFVMADPWSGEVAYSTVAEADAASFEPYIVAKFPVPQGNTYKGLVSRDATSVFYREELITGADPITFRMTDAVSLNYDVDSVFLWWKVLPQAAARTYQLLGDTSASGRGVVYGRDARSFYVDYCAVSEVDVSTVAVVDVFEGTFTDIAGPFTVDLSADYAPEQCSAITIIRG